MVNFRKKNPRVNTQKKLKISIRKQEGIKCNTADMYEMDQN